MAITIKQKQTLKQPAQVVEQVQKPKAASATTSKVITEAQALVDEAYQIQQRLVELEVPAMQKRLDEIKKHFASIAESLPPDQPAVFKGAEGEMEFSKCATSIEVTDKAGIATHLGADIYLQISKVGITDLKKYLSPIELEKFTAKVVGSRRLTAIRPL